ncbi:site-specific integrase [Nostoc sp. FACHB-87]|uniref:tyrosine-type recombinase/integrase n=1 Tax=Nostocales TaxID=1161 RepID=UPI001686A6AE|nr:MULTISPECIES: site-specific integrase [Nostocales]MBD2453076.1 site-specific integrase [Nostoc sp. FACHB-87]MBD2475146.1 site-specific integrase [Anabaena sp. FACHB-83]MBD2489431.1 site-specific integrase [Aulosira sp. FACHB-615]
MKVNRHGQAAIFSDKDFESILAAMPGENHKMILRVAYWTAGRAGEVCSLMTSDVYSPDGKPLRRLTYRASQTKTHQTRQVPIHKNLRELLINYWKINQPDISGYLFLGSEGQHLQLQSFDDAFRRALKKAKLTECGYSTHSPRRTILTQMARRGWALSMIQKFSGHRTISSLEKYIDVDEADLELAIANY